MEKQHKEFAVVEFVEEKSVEVVHASWLKNIDNQTCCYWPPKGASSKMKKGEIPDQDRWSLYAVRIFSYSDNFAKALSVARRAVDTSSVETLDEEIKRSRMKTKRWSDSDIGSDDADDNFAKALSVARRAVETVDTNTKRWSDSEIGSDDADDEEDERAIELVERPLGLTQLPPPPKAVNRPPATKHLSPSSQLVNRPSATKRLSPSSLLVNRPSSTKHLSPSSQLVNKPTASTRLSPSSQLVNRPSATKHLSPSSQLVNRPTASTRLSPSSQLVNRPTATKHLSPSSQLENRPTATTRLSPSSLLVNRPSASKHLSPSSLLVNRPSATKHLSPSSQLVNRPTATTRLSPLSQVMDRPTATTRLSPLSQVMDRPTDRLCTPQTSKRMVTTRAPEFEIRSASTSSGMSSSFQDTNLAEGFQNNVLRRLLKIEESQQEIMNTLRCIASKTCGSVTEDIDDILPKPANTVEELEDICVKVSNDKDFKKQMMFLLATCGGRDLAETARRILQKVGTNALWSLYSYKGKKAKLPFQDLAIARVILRSCLKNHTSVKALDVEFCISEILKYAPKKKGGLKYKEPYVCRRVTRVAGRELAKDVGSDSDFSTDE